MLTNVPMSETPLKDGRDASHIKSQSSVDTADGVRHRLKFDGEASGMTPDSKRFKEIVKQGDTRKSNALPGQVNMARVRCLRDSIARWNQIWM